MSVCPLWHIYGITVGSLKLLACCGCLFIGWLTSKTVLGPGCKMLQGQNVRYHGIISSIQRHPNNMHRATGFSISREISYRELLGLAIVERRSGGGAAWVAG